MNFGANMELKGNPKSRNFGDISGPLPRGGQMGIQGLQNGAKMMPKKGPRGGKMDPLDGRPRHDPRRPKDAPRRPRE